MSLITRWKLNLGSGFPANKYRKYNWVNVDTQMLELHGARINHVGGWNFIQANGVSLPFKDQTFYQVRSFHVLEHLSRDQFNPFLSECFRVLRPGCWCYLEVPDFKVIIEELYLALKTNDKETVLRHTTSVFGKTEREGMGHQWGFTHGELKHRMKVVGFDEVGRINDSEVISGLSSHWKHEPILMMKGKRRGKE